MAADEVEAKLGREALVEAAGVAGAFEIFTKVADSTGKEELPPTMLNSIGCVLRLLNCIHWSSRRRVKLLWTLLLTCGMLANDDDKMNFPSCEESCCRKSRTCRQQ